MERKIKERIVYVPAKDEYGENVALMIDMETEPSYEDDQEDVRSFKIVGIRRRTEQDKREREK